MRGILETDSKGSSGEGLLCGVEPAPHQTEGNPDALLHLNSKLNQPRTGNLQPPGTPKLKGQAAGRTSHSISQRKQKSRNHREKLKDNRENKQDSREERNQVHLTEHD